MVDFSEAWPKYYSRGQSEIHQVEDIEELGAKLQGGALAAATRHQRRILDHRDIQIFKRRPAESIPAQRAESAVVGPRAAGNVRGNVKKGRVIGATPEIVLADRAAGRKIGDADLIGPVAADGSHARLLDARIDGERQAGHEAPDPQQLPSRRQLPAEQPEHRRAIRVQVLKQAEIRGLPDIEPGRPFLRVGVERILRRVSGPDYRAHIVDGLGERVARLNPPPEDGERILRRYPRREGGR